MKKNTYFTQFDTIRFLAMLGIILYHYLTHRVSGGFLGVDIFLVLSGYLVTSQMENKYEAGIEEPYLKKLWSRIRKLWWPMIIVTLAVLAFVLIFRRELLVNIGVNLLTSLLFVNNWQQIFSGSSYFADMLHPSLTTHFWYMAVYVQFMAIWPLFFKASRKFTKTKRQSGLVMLGASVLSAILMAILFTPGEDPSRVYYGTDTRFFSIALGGAAAQLIDLKPLRERLGKAGHYLVDVLLILGISGVTWAMFNMLDGATFTYYGGMFVFNLLVAVLLALLTYQGSWIGFLLKFKPLRWLGKRSFHMYLWYYPINVLFHMVAKSNNWFTNSIWPQVALIIGLSCLSYALLEEKRWPVPIFNESRKGQPLHLMTKLKAVYAKKSPLVTKVLFTGFVSLFLAGATAIAISKPADNVTVEEQAAAEQASKIEKLNKERAAQDAKTDASLSSYKAGLSEASLGFYEGISDEQARFAYQLPITFIGDSLMVGESEGLYTLYPNAIVDAAVGRQLYTMSGFAANLAAQGMLEDVVLIDLGANGGFTSDQLSNFLDEIGRDKTIFLVNTHVDRPWSQDVNKTLAEAAANDSDSIYLLDWYSYFTSHEDAQTWLSDDGVHFNPTGGQVWLQFITDGMFNVLKK